MFSSCRKVLKKTRNIYNSEKLRWLVRSKNSSFPISLKEERRLMYVAMTCVKEYLCLSMARQRKKMGKDLTTNPSCFLLELPKQLLKISSWQTI